MKKILNISLLIFAITLVAVGCRKEEKDASLVNIWVVENIELKEITFANQINVVQQAMYKAMLEAILKEEITPYFTGWAFDFREDNRVFLTDSDGNSYGFDNYAVNGKNLSVAGNLITGTYVISKNRMHWDFDPINFLFDGDQEMFEDMGITSVVFRFTFRKK